MYFASVYLCNSSADCLVTSIKHCPTKTQNISLWSQLIVKKRLIKSDCTVIFSAEYLHNFLVETHYNIGDTEQYQKLLFISKYSLLLIKKYLRKKEI